MQKPASVAPARLVLRGVAEAGGYFLRADVLSAPLLGGAGGAIMRNGELLKRGQIKSFDFGP